MNVYNFTVKDNKGNDVPLSEYDGKVLLIVNTATGCGLTPQYSALEALYLKYKDRGFAVLDFPCNQFLKQAPGTDEEIQDFCTLNYNTTFPRFKKIAVNGKDAEPLYIWLRKQAPEDQGDEEAKKFAARVRLIKPFARSSDIHWNFCKFLIGRDGEVRGRYAPAFTPEKLESVIEEALGAGSSAE